MLHAGLFDPAAKIPDVAGWLNDAAFEVHLNESSLAQFRRETAGMIENISLPKCAFAD